RDSTGALNPETREAHAPNDFEAPVRIELDLLYLGRLRIGLVEVPGSLSRRVHASDVGDLERSAVVRQVCRREVPHWDCVSKPTVRGVVPSVDDIEGVGSGSRIGYGTVTATSAAGHSEGQRDGREAESSSPFVCSHLS